MSLTSHASTPYPTSNGMSHVSGLHDGDVSTAFRQEKADVGEDRAAPGVHAIRHEEPLSKSWPGVQAMLESPTKACPTSKALLISCPLCRRVPAYV